MTDFGRDLSCSDSLASARFSTGARLVAESDYRRLTTPRGMLRGGEEDQNYGLPLTELVGTASTAASVAALPGLIRAELLKDDRHESVDVVVTATTSGPRAEYVVDITGNTAAGPFTLTIAASAVTTALIGLTP